MTAVFYISLICAVVLFWVGSALLMRYAERRWPRLRAFLDRHVGEEPEWLRPW